MTNITSDLNVLNELYDKFQTLETPLEKNAFLHETFHKSSRLAFDLMLSHIREMLPIIYTPTVAAAVKAYPDELRHPQALYLSYEMRGKLEEILKEHQDKSVQVIVVTDGERVLGIGDQGAAGVEISVAKLMLYSLFADIAPEHTLPIVLDLGTNNENLLQNENYFGLHQQRVAKDDYDAFIEEFVNAVKKTWPDTLLQWEDFGKNNAARILEKYRDKILSFNDDIQGTAVVTLAAILGGIEITKTKLDEQKIVIFGAGSSGIGISNLISSVLRNHFNLSETESRQNLWLLNSKGLITEKSANISAQQKPYLRSLEEVNSWQKNDQDNIELLTVIKEVKPTVLIGCSGVGGAFNKEIIEAMSENVKRPIVLSLSNPTANSEAKPEDVINWSKGQALVATGSPFPAVKYGDRTINIAQCNNAFSFPGMGLGLMRGTTKEVTDDLFYKASLTIFNNSPAKKSAQEELLPPIEDAPSIAKQIADEIIK